MNKKENQKRFYRNRGGYNRFRYKYKNQNTHNKDLPGGSRQQSEKESSSEDESLDNDPNCPYNGWKLYFSHEVYSESSHTVFKVKTVENFIKKNRRAFRLSDIEESYWFTFDIKLIEDDSDFQNSWPEFNSDLHNEPVHTINCISLAMHQIVWNHLKKKLESDDEDDGEDFEITVPTIRARVINFGNVIPLKDLRASYYGKLVSLKGTIIRVGHVKLKCTNLAFECKLCSTVQCNELVDGVYNLPEKCKKKSCKSQKFIPLLSSPFTQTLNWQYVKLQEIVADEHADGGRVPRTIECELTADLVDSCSPGDIVVLSGIVKTRREEGRRNKTTSIFQICLDIVSIINNKVVLGPGQHAVKFSLKDYYAIREIHSEKQLFRLVVQSLCPSIYGHEVVKAGLILCMFGGCQRDQDLRAEPHILIVGDPGLGKSRLLQACANVAPRGVYVCGNTSTSSGLTVTLNRESGGDYILEAGALVLSDQGCCCIDEFDKMASKHQALLEAMEQQTVSIAKAGIVCSLPARTSVLAAANPVDGHYNKAKTVSENLKLGRSLLSRFDLVFILLDQPNAEMDILLSEHVMALHSGAKKPNQIHLNTPSTPGTSSANLGDSIERRLKVQRFEELDLIPHELLRKYIAYARKYVKPWLSDEAADLLQQFYLQLRKVHRDLDGTPVTTRQLESLIRLTEARAKVELREEATLSDAQDVIEILKYSMWDTFSDGFTTIEFKTSQSASGKRSASQEKRFIRCLQRRAEMQSCSAFSMNEMKTIAQDSDIHVTDFHGFITKLNMQGFLLKKQDNHYQLVTD